MDELKPKLRKLNIRLVIAYCICLPIMILALWGHSTNGDEWVEEPRNEFQKHTGPVTKCFLTGKSNMAASIDLSNGKHITLPVDKTISGRVTVYSYSANGVNYYAFTEGSLYVKANADTRRALVFLCMLCGFGPLIWYTVSMVRTVDKYEKERNKDGDECNK